jgi:hypothetical protein
LDFSSGIAGPARKALLQCDLVTDWRQIQARIRKARTSPDPPAQLAALYERTRDAMVAFELAQIHEKAGTPSEAARWYTAAAERFRRAQWKVKAEEALTRLGAPIPPPLIASDLGTQPPSETLAAPATESAPMSAESIEETVQDDGMGGNSDVQQISQEQPGAGVSPVSIAATAQGHRRKRRGRRGGRGRNKGARSGATTTAPIQPVLPITPPAPTERTSEPEAMQSSVAQISSFEAVEDSRARQAEPLASAEEAPSGAQLHLRVRSGDPALSSRTVKLESQLRRMLACSVHSVDQPDDAPAGPGVFLITDTEQTCYYYIEACQTLRVGIGNLLRSGRNSREGAGLKERLAEHLGINESRVGKYLKDHCVVRWLQLDEGAPFLAHFATAVLRPIAND